MSAPNLAPSNQTMARSNPATNLARWLLKKKKSQNYNEKKDNKWYSNWLLKKIQNYYEKTDNMWYSKPLIF